jgi:hypothetical protein
VPAAGPDALAVAIYEHPTGVVHAQESGFEGVACVDDTARLLTVLCDVWVRTQLDWVQRWALGLLDFVLWMQEPDGTWLNFIYDWDGGKNRTGITSRPGQNFWLARALVGVQRAGSVFPDGKGVDAFRLGLAVAAAQKAPPDIRSLHLLTALYDHHEPPLVRRWADELVACRDGDVLKNSAFEVGMPHLWAHIQEGVLAASSQVLDDPALLDVAVRSAEAVIVPAVRGRFTATHSSVAYDVSSCVWSLDQLATATGNARWAKLAAEGRAWFDGQNAAGAPVYDRERGVVADGIDHDTVSANSGAESNIVAAEVFQDHLVSLVEEMHDPFGDTTDQ